MGVADQLTQAATTYNPVPSAPAGVFRGDGDPGTLENTDFADLRQDRVQVVTLSSFAGTDSFTLTVRLDSGGRITTVAFVRGTNATAAAIQTALRTATGDTALTVTGTTDEGPFTITHTKATFRKLFPKYTVNGTGCTGVVTYDQAAGEGDATIGALGESDRVSNTDSILKPTIGTITVTDGTDEVQTFTESNGTDGGTVDLNFKGRATGGIAYNASAAEVQDIIEDAFGQITGHTTDDAPTVAVAGVEVATLDLDDIGAADTYKLTYNSVQTAGTYGGVVAGLNTYASTDTADIQLMVDELLGGTGEAVVARVDANTYTITRTRPGAFASTFTATTVTGFTPLGSGGYTAGGKITTAASATPSYTFTFENGTLAGRPVGGDFGVYSDALTDGGVEEPGALTVTTPGVLGSASIAYTENGAGSDVLAASVNDDTGVSYGFVKDAATPVVTASLPPGPYHAILRTVEDGRVSKADTKAFTVAST